MRIGCLMVTENRAPVVGIAVASYRAQQVKHFDDAVLLVYDNSAKAQEYRTALQRPLEVDPRLKTQYYTSSHASGKLSVPARIDEGFNILTEHYACDVICMWDDDDYSPPARLQQTGDAFLRGVELSSYTAGYFVNLRSFEAQYFSRCTDLWGGCLALTRELWRGATRDRWSFRHYVCPGYDSEFVKEARRREVKVEGWCPPVQEDVAAHPLAFVHGKNCATFINDRTVNVGEAMEKTLTPAVWREIEMAQKFMVERRVFP